MTLFEMDGAIDLEFRRTRLARDLADQRERRLRRRRRAEARHVVGEPATSPLQH